MSAMMGSSIQQIRQPDSESNGGDDASKISSSGGNDSSSNEDSSNSTPQSSSHGSTSNGISGMLASNKDDRQIFGAKIAFICCLLSSAIGLGVVVYHTTKAEQHSGFQVEFENAANGVREASNDNLLKVFDTLGTLSQTTTTFIRQEQERKNGTYPLGFVTLADSEYHMGRARNKSGAYFLAYAPSVEGQDYPLWAEYVEDNLHWLEEAWEADGLVGSLSTVETQIWTVFNFDEDGNQIQYDASVCFDKEEEHQISRSQVHIERPDEGPASPIWTISPPPDPKDDSRINYDMLTSKVFEVTLNTVKEYREPTFQVLCKFTKFFDPDTFASTVETVITYPVFGSFEADAPIVGHYFAIVPWHVYFQNKLPHGTPAVQAVLTSSCGHEFTYQIEGREATLLHQEADVHDHYYDDIFIEHMYAAYANDTCEYHLVVYPTHDFEDRYKTNEPVHYMLVVIAIFVATSLAFLLFDYLVTRRQTALMTTARKQNALVSSLFPKSIQKKLMEDMEGEEKEKSKFRSNKSGTAGLRSYLNEGLLDPRKKDDNKDFEAARAKPIADLFPETTIMFADIAGFTAWSSTREPSQVFTLLEGVYHEFDVIAKRRRVFKVEVVGDCYVAVAGLPDPRPDHAVVMGKFANDCLKKMHEVTNKLEIELGPDTTELGLRVGLHSGPVVAGVLRGDKSRFQLFGDTMNTTSRMESTGVANRIHMSQDTANLLISAGKEKWVVPREQKVSAKGKGELTTYFLDMNSRETDDRSFGSVSDLDGNLLDVVLDNAAAEERRNRTAEWTVEVMSSVLRTMAAKRKSTTARKDPSEKIEAMEMLSLSHTADRNTVISEVAAYIILPEHSTKQYDGSEVLLDEDVICELRNYVQTIASLYNENPFHNFDHANHVVMSVNKLLSRIIAPDIETTGKGLHDHTYGITSDPLTWFACVFSALIHDVDHSGISNAQLVKEGAPVAMLYKAKSVAEQNSFDIAWDLLMEPCYKNLRSAIYVNESEFRRFRQLVVNSVMATDIVDKDLKKLRNDRWDAVFSDDPEKDQCATRRAIVLKATIVIEHLIQASDVAHTMQHWHIYRRWNEKFFKECYQAYLDGRSEDNPAKNWYKGEIGFFDFYIIPLAKKLKDCGVFGVSSDEYLSYALQNRKEWEDRGEDMVKEMVKEARRKDLAVQRQALKNNFAK